MFVSIKEIIAKKWYWDTYIGVRFVGVIWK